MKFDLHILQAMSGDSILLSYFGNDCKIHNILIDGGMPNTFKKIQKIIDDNEIVIIDYIFLTHIDRDHIGGILKLLDSSYAEKVKKVFFNSGHMIKYSDSTFVSEDDGISLIEDINHSDTLKSNREEITIETKYNLFGLEISFLSPTYEALINFNQLVVLPKVKEEALISDSEEEPRDNIGLYQLSTLKFPEKKLKNDFSNGVSLAMLVKYHGISILLLGDAKDSVLIPVIRNHYSKENKLKVDYIKLSHHGSKFHTSNDFLALVECNNFIISANGTNKHPNIETLARILCHEERDKNQKIYFYFNYEEEDYRDKNVYLLSEKEQQDYNCECIYNKTLFDLVG